MKKLPFIITYVTYPEKKVFLQANSILEEDESSYVI